LGSWKSDYSSVFEWGQILECIDLDAASPGKASRKTEILGEILGFFALQVGLEGSNGAEHPSR
jgi:hypothetical protein